MTIKIDFDKLEKQFPKAYFDFASGCVEPGYDDKPVILANWNHVSDKVFDNLEKKGFSCEWSDEWITCDSCYKVFRSSPSSYSWQMSGIIRDGGALCLECLDPWEYYQFLENNPKQAVTWPIAEKYSPTEYGYTLVQSDYENGFHPGQNSDPKEILSGALKQNPNGKFLFVMDGQGQFDIEFSLYIRNNESEE